MRLGVRTGGAQFRSPGALVHIATVAAAPFGGLFAQEHSSFLDVACEIEEALLVDSSATAMLAKTRAISS